MAWRSINSIRALAMDAVEQAQSGHPGTPMALAPAAYVLWPVVGIEGFGASAPSDRLYQEFKLTPEQVAATAKRLLASR